MSSSRTSTAKSRQSGKGEIFLREPQLKDGAAIFQLVQQCPPLDVNSCYAYLLICHHHAHTSVVAEWDGRIVGFVSGYLPPLQPDAFFVWQVAVHSDARGKRLGLSMLRHLLQRPVSKPTRYLETTVSPSNQASRATFARLAQDLETVMSEQPLFDKAMFGEGAAHEDEMLLRIGPFH